jgi:Ni/Fe-hydrogenase subunit HybB-like protein
MADLGRAASIILFLYLIVKFADLAVRGAWVLILEQNLQSNLFLLEMLGGVALPAILLSFRRVRNMPRGLLVSSLLVMAGIVLNRMNVCWIGMSVSDQLSYIPTWMEVAVSLGSITAGTIAFFLAVHYLPIFPDAEKELPKETSLDPIPD